MDYNMYSDKNSVVLQNGLYVTKYEKENYFTNDYNNTDKIETITLDDYYNNILRVKDNLLNMFYHEFLLQNNMIKFKLFLDIDLDISKKNINNLNNIDLTQKLNDVVDEVIDYLIKNPIVIFYNIEKDIISDEKELETILKKNIKYTQSTDKNKLSFHIIFNNILLNITNFQNLKQIFSCIINSSKNILTKNIDLQLFRNYTQLRTIYSIKSNDKINNSNYHIEYNDTISCPQDLKNYFFTYIDLDNDNKDSLNLEIQNNEIKIIKNKIQTPEDNIIYPHILYLQPYHIIISIRKLVKNKIKYNEKFNNLKFKLDDIIPITFIIDENNPCWCLKKDVHKNTHYILIKKNIILVKKFGNEHNCRQLKIPYPTLSIYQICEYYVNMEYIIRLDSGDYSYWNGIKWIFIEENVQYKTLLLSKKNNFNHIEKFMIENKFQPSKIKDTIQSILSEKKIKPYINPYIVAFENGVYDILNEKFIVDEEAKKYLCLSSVGYEYKEIELFSEDEKKEYFEQKKYIEKVIDDIIPPNNKKNREVFERNVSSVLLRQNKPIIIFFVGPTRAGKTTMKELIKTMVGSNNYVQTSVDVYCNNVDSQKPHASKGKISYKLVSFASEPGKDKILKSENIKNMTEIVIKARQLHSNKDDQINFLTQIIDSNYLLDLDFEDSATVRRISVINFNSYFTFNGDVGMDLYADGRKPIFIDENLDLKINKGVCNQIIFDIFRVWCKKYHKDGLNMVSTPEKLPRTFIKIIFCEITIKSTYIKPDYLKQEVMKDYQPIVLREKKKNLLTHGLLKETFIDKFKNYIEDDDINKTNDDLLIFYDEYFKNKLHIPYIFIEDLKEDKIPNIIHEYKLKTGKDFPINKCKERISLKIQLDSKKK